MTVKVTALLVVPLTVTVTFTEPFDRPDGTVATIEGSLQLVVDAITPPILTVLPPLVAPKPLPVMVTEVPDAPDVGDRLEMTGAANREPLARTTNKKQVSELSSERLERIALSL